MREIHIYRVQKEYSTESEYFYEGVSKLGLLEWKDVLWVWPASLLKLVTWSQSNGEGEPGISIYFSFLPDCGCNMTNVSHPYRQVSPGRIDITLKVWIKYFLSFTFKKIFPCVCVCSCLFICEAPQVPMDSRRGLWIAWNWTYLWLWASPNGWWQSNPGTLKKQLLPSESRFWLQTLPFLSFLLSQIFSQHCICVIINV